MHRWVQKYTHVERYLKIHALDMGYKIDVDWVKKIRIINFRSGFTTFIHQYQNQFPLKKLKKSKVLKKSFVPMTLSSSTLNGFQPPPL